MKLHRTLLIAATLLLTTSRVWGGPEDTHLGMGLTYLKLSDIHPSVASDSAPVVNVMLGSRGPHAAGDLVLSYAKFNGNGEATAEPYYPATDVTYLAVDSVFRIYFRNTETHRVLPWVSLGGGVHFLGLEGAYYPNYGYQLIGGAGIDITLNETAYLRLGGQGRYYSVRDYWLVERTHGGAVGFDITVIWIIPETLGDRPKDGGVS